MRLALKQHIQKTFQLPNFLSKLHTEKNQFLVLFRNSYKVEADGDDWNSESPFDRIIRVAAYALWIPIMYITQIWIWPVVCKSAGITHQEALELGNSRKKIIPKLIHRSKKPKQTKIFALIHNYISLPAYIAALIYRLGNLFSLRISWLPAPLTVPSYCYHQTRKQFRVSDCRQKGTVRIRFLFSLP